MRNTIVATMVLTLITGLVRADEFSLKHDSTGKVYGPFQAEAGAKVTLGTTSFTVIKQTSSLSAVEAKLAGITIPEADFRHARLEDAVSFLMHQTEAFDPQHTGVNFVIAKNSTPKPTPANDPFGGMSENLEVGPMVTFSLKKVSALQVLNTLMEQTGYSYKTSENIVTIYPKK